MGVGPVLQWITFGLFAFVAIAGALGMTTTMSMFRSGIFLMASFTGVAGLFILLLADLLALLQVMMYIGGMLVMILFMVLVSHDPGGAMMAGMMPLRGPERLFSLGLAQRRGADRGGEAEHGAARVGQHAGPQGQHGQQGEHGQHGGQTQHGGPMPDGGRMERGGDHGGMSMAEMSMFTPIKKPAAVLAGLIGALLVALLLLRPGWAVVRQMPDQDSPRRIGHMLMGKYMIAFEGAGLLILLGIFGAALVSRPGRYADRVERGALRAAVDERPAPIEADLVEPACGGVHAGHRPGEPPGAGCEAPHERRHGAGARGGCGEGDPEPDRP